MATVKEHSPRYEVLKERYERNGCTKAQLKKFVQYSVLTATEYEEITGEKYN